SAMHQRTGILWRKLVCRRGCLFSGIGRFARIEGFTAPAVAAATLQTRDAWLILTSHPRTGILWRKLVCRRRCLFSGIGRFARIEGFTAPAVTAATLQTRDAWLILTSHPKTGILWRKLVCRRRCLFSGIGRFARIEGFTAPAVTAATLQTRDAWLILTCHPRTALLWRKLVCRRRCLFSYFLLRQNRRRKKNSFAACPSRSQIDVLL
ncbi:MAG: hypothetical protein Q4D60_11330, partial [Eubacteriales bacterium]|nr:hypothetical protein [Eubacteriales bacterium]